MPGTLVAGFGNVLRGDDGFGVEVVRQLEASIHEPGDVVFMEVGTGGIRLAQELLAPYDRLIIVDAMSRGGAPGSVYVLSVEDVEPATAIDMHAAVPARALTIAKALGALPAEIYLVGCEPADVDELTTELSSIVRPAVQTAIEHIRRLLSRDGKTDVSEGADD